MICKNLYCATVSCVITLISTALGKQLVGAVALTLVLTLALAQDGEKVD